MIANVRIPAAGMEIAKPVRSIIAKAVQRQIAGKRHNNLQQMEI